MKYPLVCANLNRPLLLKMRLPRFEFFMIDYKSTLNLPQTCFPMKANLPNKEPAILNQWSTTKLYSKIRQWAKGRPSFILHDGPPYANGELHLGHAINKVLKDIIIKSKTFSGYDAPYIPGWDCHGLPIEHKVEQKVGKAGTRFSEKQFRQKCRDYAQKQIDLQREGFVRLGVLANWSSPYLTMNYRYEADIVRALAKMIDNGHLQRGYKPVYWSVVGQSALAEAEVEYQEKQSNSVYIRYPVSTQDETHMIRSFTQSNTGKGPLSIAVWTTTPWTLPSSQAVALGSEIEYALVQCTTSQGQERFIMAAALLPTLVDILHITQYNVLGTTLGKNLEKLTACHPFYEKILPIILGAHVTTDSGTGCVHTAPDHGIEDFNVSHQYGLKTLGYVSDSGIFHDNVPYFSGEHIYKVDEKIISKLQEKNQLLHHEVIRHSYPHCWRTKTPLIYRATPQWFISMTQNHLLDQCKAALQHVTFTPKWGKNRLQAMLNNCPDWCISRQRTWGVPITLFIHNETHERHPNTIPLMENIAQIIEKKGIDSWLDLKPDDLLPANDLKNYTKVTDTLDVWFDSGVSHMAVVHANQLAYPADLYLEGSDQHRGWFQSSLKTGVAIDKIAPYKQILTHGFTVDEHGRKMSKSLGNVITLKEATHQMGSDILRLWTASVDYSHDITVSKEVFQRISETYRRIRNTIRFLLANLHQFDPDTDLLPTSKMLPFDAWIVGRAYQLQQELIHAYQSYQFSVVYHKIHNFCVTELGGLYLDIIKDRQYTTPVTSSARRSCQTALYHIAEAVVRWIAPILSFTAEENMAIFTRETFRICFFITLVPFANAFYA